MKKFGFKIALSCAALAASAATLATTTFAWYTSNAKVTAANITAGTSDTGASTLQISTQLTQNYGSAIDFSQASNKGAANNNNLDNGLISQLLVPVQYGNDGNGTATTANQGATLANGQKSIFYSQGAAIAQAQAGVANNTTAADSGAVVNFSLFFKNPGASEAATLYLNKFSIENTSASLRATQVAAPTRAGIPASFTANNYTVDLLRALKIAVWSTTYNDGVADPQASDKKQVWGVNGYSAGTDSIADGAMGGEGAWDAHLYLNDARGFVEGAGGENEAIPDTEKITSNYYELTTGSGAASVTLGDIPAVVVDASNEDPAYALVADQDVLRCDFFIFVDGWDYACFDAVQGQSFKLDLGFALISDAGNADYTIVS
jgi:hypothetical protein